jgi:hypothetical protein
MSSFKIGLCLANIRCLSDHRNPMRLRIYCSAFAMFVASLVVLTANQVNGMSYTIRLTKQWSLWTAGWVFFMVLLGLLELTSGFCSGLQLTSETGLALDQTEKAESQSARPTTAYIQICRERIMIYKPLNDIECSANGMSYTIHKPSACEPPEFVPVTCCLSYSRSNTKSSPNRSESRAGMRLYTRGKWNKRIL